MKAIISIIIGVLVIFGTVVHIWTTIIGFQEGGFWGGILTLFFPVISELYWMIKMFGENNLYSILCLVTLVFGGIMGLMRS